MAKKRKNPSAVRLGKRRMAGLTAEQRSRLGRKAARARWKRKRKAGVK